MPDVTTSIDPRARIGAVELTVDDLGREREFYERTVGLRTLASSDGRASMGPAGGPAILELVADPGAAPRPPGGGRGRTPSPTRQTRTAPVRDPRFEQR